MALFIITSNNAMRIAMGIAIGITMEIMMKIRPASGGEWQADY
ncbi:hypothetical protein ACSAZK_17280 [Methanosarcina sp. Mfa9]